MKILITGVAGMIGSNLAQHLWNKGHEVYGIDDLSGGYKDFIPKGVTFYEFNILDQKKLNDLFTEVKPEVVYHLAAYAAEGLSPFIRNFNYTNNLIASVNIINECVKHAAKLIFASSIAIYGDQPVPFKEFDLPNPVDPYGIAKYAVEMDIKQASEQFGLRYSIVRPHNVIGLNQNIWDKYRNVIGIWIRQILNSEDVTIFGDGFQKRAFSDVTYCCEALEKLMTIGDGETYNIGADTEYSILSIAEMVKDIGSKFGYNPKIKHLPARHEVKIAYCDHMKAKLELGFSDKTNLAQTIKKMFQWAITQPDREVKTMDYELDKNMYDIWK